MANQTYSTRKVTVGTVKKSMAAIAPRRLRRNQIQSSSAPGAGRRRGRYLDTVRSDTSIPSMRNSPWMRGAPQVGFSADQGAEVLADGRTPLATMVLRQPRPLLAEPGPVPADHCLRLYEQKHFGPSHPDSTQGHPEHSVSNSDPWTSAAVDEGG